MSKNDTTNSQDWLSAYRPETKQDAFDLYDAVTTAPPCGKYDVSGGGGNVFVRVPVNQNWRTLAVQQRKRL